MEVIGKFFYINVKLDDDYRPAFFPAMARENEFVIFTEDSDKFFFVEKDHEGLESFLKYLEKDLNRKIIRVWANKACNVEREDEQAAIAFDECLKQSEYEEFYLVFKEALKQAFRAFKHVNEDTLTIPQLRHIVANYLLDNKHTKLYRKLSSKKFDELLLKAERKRFIQIQSANDPQKLVDVPDGIKTELRGLLYYVNLIGGESNDCNQ